MVGLDYRCIWTRALLTWCLVVVLLLLYILDSDQLETTYTSQFTSDHLLSLFISLQCIAISLSNRFKVYCVIFSNHSEHPLTEEVLISFFIFLILHFWTECVLKDVNKQFTEGRVYEVINLAKALLQNHPVGKDLIKQNGMCFPLCIVNRFYKIRC